MEELTGHSKARKAKSTRESEEAEENAHYVLKGRK
jgi:hypothetical protein